MRPSCASAAWHAARIEAGKGEHIPLAGEKKKLGSRPISFTE